MDTNTTYFCGWIHNIYMGNPTKIQKWHVSNLSSISSVNWESIWCKIKNYTNWQQNGILKQEVSRNPYEKWNSTSFISLLHCWTKWHRQKEILTLGSSNKMHSSQCQSITIILGWSSVNDSIYSQPSTIQGRPQDMNYFLANLHNSTFYDLSGVFASHCYKKVKEISWSQV